MCADGIKNYSGNPSGVMSFAFVSPPVPGLSGHVELQRKYKSATERSSRVRAGAENKTAIKVLGDRVDCFRTEVHFFEGLRGVNTALIERSKSEIMGNHTTVNSSTSLSAVPLMPGFALVSKHTAEQESDARTTQKLRRA